MNSEMFNSMFISNENTWRRLTTMMATDDDLGCLLRIHLMTENMLEAWCCSASNNPLFFKDFGANLTMSYIAKLKLASNFGLNSFSYNELKEINKIRNAHSHQIDNYAISDLEISTLMKLIRKGDQNELVDSPSCGIWVDEKMILLNDQTITNRQKLVAILGLIIFRVSNQANGIYSPITL